MFNDNPETFSIRLLMLLVVYDWVNCDQNEKRKKRKNPLNERRRRRSRTKPSNRKMLTRDQGA